MNQSIWLSLILVLSIGTGCSKANDLNLLEIRDINIISKHAYISDYELVKKRILEFIKLGISDLNSHSQIFEDTWVHSLHSKKRWPSILDIELEEHQPLARLSNNSYLTHTGHIIFPEETNTNIDVLYIDAPDSETLELLYLSRDLQSQFNIINRKLKKIESHSNGLIEVEDDRGTTLIFSKKDFRVQLDRLEDFISFELSSGRLENIRNIDFRYTNAIAVDFS
tara:strand:+ start:165 stop:836 length:672 start_codon:yes stop_codon:yes gene_type:complete